MTKNFFLADVLNITTGGRLLSSKGLSGVQEILVFMTGKHMHETQIERAIKKCKSSLLEQFPELAKASSPKNMARLDTLIEDSKHHKGESAESAIELWLKWMAEPGTCDLKQEYEVKKLPE